MLNLHVALHSMLLFDDKCESIFPYMIHVRECLVNSKGKLLCI